MPSTYAPSHSSSATRSAFSRATISGIRRRNASSAALVVSNTNRCTPAAAADGAVPSAALKNFCASQARQGPLDAPASLHAEAAVLAGTRQQVRHRLEVEHRAMRRAERGTQGRLLERLAGAQVVGTQDVVQADDQPPDALPGNLCLFALHDRPGVPDESCRQMLIAVDQFAVDAERVPCLAQVAQVRLAGRGGVLCFDRLPGLPQRTDGPHGHAGTDLTLDFQRPAPDAFTGHPGGRHFSQCGVDDLRQRLGEFTVRLRVAPENHREVVAQVGQIAVRGEQSRPHAGHGGRVGRRAAGEVEDDLVSKWSAHGCSGIYCGHTVNLSNSPSRVARMPSAVRSAPAWRRSS